MAARGAAVGAEGTETTEGAYDDRMTKNTIAAVLVCTWHGDTFRPLGLCGEENNVWRTQKKREKITLSII